MDKLGIANTIVQSNATSPPISSVAFVAMPGTWLGIAQTGNAELIGAMMPLLEFLVALPQDVLVVVMPLTVNTRYVTSNHLFQSILIINSNLCKSLVVVPPPTALPSASKLARVASKMVHRRVTEIETRSRGSAVRLEDQRHGNAVETTVDPVKTLVDRDRLRGLRVVVAERATDMHKMADMVALLLEFLVALHPGSRLLHLHQVEHRATVAMEGTLDTETLVGTLRPAWVLRPVLEPLLGWAHYTSITAMERQEVLHPRPRLVARLHLHLVMLLHRLLRATSRRHLHRELDLCCNGSWLGWISWWLTSICHAERLCLAVLDWVEVTVNSFLHVCFVEFV